MRALAQASKGKISSVATLPPGFEALLAAFVAHMQSLRMSLSTVKGRLRAARMLGGWCQGQGIEEVRALGRKDVDEYVKWLRAQALSPNTVENWLSGMKAFFRFLVETNRLLINPAEHVRERNLQHLMGPTISAEEADRVLDAPNTSLPIGVRDRAILELLYSTGIRREELRRLTIFDVDLAGGLLRVLGKGGAHRVLPLGVQVTKWLRTYLGNVRPKLGRRKHARDGEQTLFLGREGGPLTIFAIHALVIKHGRDVGVRVSCHTLRRSMGAEMLKRGADLRSIAKLLGHVRITTTQKYTKVMPVDLRRVHDRLHPRGGK